MEPTGVEPGSKNLNKKIKIANNPKKELAGPFLSNFVLDNFLTSGKAKNPLPFDSLNSSRTEMKQRGGFSGKQVAD